MSDVEGIGLGWGYRVGTKRSQTPPENLAQMTTIRMAETTLAAAVNQVLQKAS